MNNIFLGLKFAFSYFSIFPIKFKESDDLSKKEVLNFTLVFLPFVGFVLGSLIVLIYLYISSLDWLAAILCSCLYMIFYGFIHTEAIIDVVDAIYAKHSGKDAYEVIKEPTVGAIGVLYAVVLVILKIAAFSFLFLHNLFYELIIVAIISRVSILFTIYYFDFKSSFVTTLKEAFGSKSFFYLLVVYAILIVLLTKFSALIFLFSGFVFAFFIGKFLKSKLGFLNGDALGFSLELIEILLAIWFAFLWA